MPKIKYYGGIELKNKLYELGLTEELAKRYENEKIDGYYGRIITEYKGIYKVATEEEEILARLTGKLGSSFDSKILPAVGDWVIVDRTTSINGDGIISKILPRKSQVSRKTAGQRTDEQVIASNIDTIFICMAADNDFNLRRLERFITIGWDSGATPVVIITKSDLSSDLMMLRTELEEVAIGVDVLFVSSMTGDGIQAIDKYLKPGYTIGFMGSSGVGKSTLINYLAGEEKMETQGVRQDDSKGRHTTTHRELIVIKDRGIVIDTPGMREIQLLDNIEGVSNSFRDITDLASGCKFNDCSHTEEPGCAVLLAIEQGILQEERFHSYNKLLKEAKYMERKNNYRSMQEHKKSMSKLISDAKKKKYR